MLNKLAYAQGVDAGMAKFAISRLRRYARDITQAASRSGDPTATAKAQNIVAQAYKPRVLGTGAEGTATLHMLPQTSAGGALTPTVRKEFDPNAPLASPTMVDRRIALGPALNRSGDFPQFYGHGRTSAGAPYIDSEFIPKPVAPGADVSKAQANIDRSLRSAGMRSGMGHMTAKDIRPDNLGVNPRTGKTVALDYMPMRRQEVYDPRYARMLGDTDTTRPFITDRGAHLFPHQAQEHVDPEGRMEKALQQQMARRMVANPRSVLPPRAGQTKEVPATPLPAPPLAGTKTAPARPAMIPPEQLPILAPTVVRAQ